MMHKPRRRRWHHRLRHSLRGRLVALFLLLALGTTLVFVAGTGQVFSSGWRELIRPLITDYLDRLTAEIGSPPNIQKAQAIVDRLPLSITITGPEVQWRSHPLPERYGSDPRPHDQAGRAMLSRRTVDGHELRFGVRSLRWDDERPRWVGWLTLAGLLLLTAAAFACVRHWLRPLDDIRAGAQRYEAGDFSQPIPERRRDELGELAGRVNAMASGLRHMLDNQRGLLLAISHELRSPLTRARLNAELLADGDERQALLRDLGQMRDLIANLLESERLSAGRATLQLQPTDLAALVKAVVQSQFAGQSIALALQDGLTPLPLDPARIELLVRNLIDNALRHGSGGAQPVEVSLRRTDQNIELAVRDHGPGVQAEHLARLAEPFYRTDQARSRNEGGVGLGLYLCKQVARSHGGRLDIHLAQPGLAVVLVLPAGPP
ncbi:MAG: HAMP domain-containing histidine kinase [Ideonella sp.]|nr:HAMP domain-containing histidine kinase [Ideonella sp.]